MSLLLDARALGERTRTANGSLAGIATGLRAELEPLLAGDLVIPAEKALLTREGGRCTCDGWYLPYDPFSAHHRCDRCGREYGGPNHDRFRLYWHHLWLAERTLHAAVLGVLTNDPRCRLAATTLLDRYASQYLDWPNVDNVLGPSRPFFSTYLESIWLLQLSLALDLLETGAPSPDLAVVGGRVRDRVIAPSSALIASYDEGMSNRQVWNNAALIASARLLGDPARMDRTLAGSSGVQAHLEHAILPDGSWYEGENYHFFAHRGLWYAMQMAEHAGERLPSALRARFAEGFAAPFRTLLPDLTFPSRRDSQYAISARQPRFAETCELGLARGDDDRLLGVLARLYDADVPRGDTGRSRTSADVERNLPATGLTRNDMSWRGLLFAREQLPPLEATPMRSDLLPAQGIGILRRDEGRVYVALDYGHSGGGHGHPDRLNLLLVDGEKRWFDDPGTGSYVDASLHWYRSTLAHTAPLIGGRSQPRVHGELLAFDEQGHAGWISAIARLGDVLVRRSVVVTDAYLVDALTWEAVGLHEITLPLQGVDVVDEAGQPHERTATDVAGGSAEDDGFAYLQDGATIQMGAAPMTLLRAAEETSPDRALAGWVHSDPRAVWQVARAPGPPGSPALRPLAMARATGRTGRIASVWSWRNAVSGVHVSGDELHVTRASGRIDLHRSHPSGWEIELGAGPRIVLASLQTPPGASERDWKEPAPARAAHATAPASRVRLQSLPARYHLAEAHYRRSELTWLEAGTPSADVTLELRDHTLHIVMEASNVARRFIPIGAENPFDNEPFAINGDGVQLYARAGNRSGGWLLVPRDDSLAVDRRDIAGWDGLEPPSARWSSTLRGYVMSIELPLPAGEDAFALDLLVNDGGSGRERRRGQLVLSGAAAGGEFVYLRGDRHDPARLLHFSLTDV